VNFFGGNEVDGARLDFGNPALDLTFPGSLGFDVSLALQGLQKLFCKASSILGGQGLGSRRQFLD
jgi:hypothetical protein